MTTEMHWWKNKQYFIIASFDAVTMPAYGRMHTSNRYHMFSNYPWPAS